MKSNWLKRIEKAEKREYFLSADIHNSKLWSTCAVQQICNVNLRGLRISKQSQKVREHCGGDIWDLGGLFYEAVYDHKMERARTLFHRIEILWSKKTK